MADNNTARVYNMSHPPSMDDSDGSAPAGKAGEEGSKPTREKRKKKLDASKLQTLFRTFAYQYGSNLAWDTVNRIPILISNLRHTFGNDEVRMWMNSEKRRDVMADQVVFDPSAKCGPGAVNLFGGLEMVPIDGDCSELLDLLMFLVNGDQVVYDWVLDWIAYPLQNLGAKMPTACIFHGDEGSGKNLFWEVVRDLYGEYGSVVGQSELESVYNDWISKQMFIIGDEVLSRQEMRHLKGKLKAMISGTSVQIQAKFLPVRAEINHVNMVFLSNELQPNALDSTDRRYLVVWTPYKRDRSYYLTVKACINSGGREAFFALLMKRDLSKFDPYAPPPMTGAKRDLIDLGRPNAERFYLTWKAGHIPIPLQACSSDQAYRLYKRWCQAEGERFYVTKNVFVRMVMRIAGDHMTVKTIRTSVTRVQKVWLTTQPPEGVELGTWAGETIDAFESELKGYSNDQ